MRTILSFFLLVTFCICFAACGGVNDGWATYTSGDGGFSINMPANPKKTEKTDNTAFGKQVVHLITWKPSAFSISKLKLFQISYTNCPARYFTDTIMRDVMLDSCMRMRIKDFTDKDMNGEPIDFNGYPGRAFIFEGGNNTTVTVKEFFANNRKYDLCVVAKSNQGTSTEIGTFFNSFQIIH